MARRFINRKNPETHSYLARAGKLARFWNRPTKDANPELPQLKTAPLKLDAIVNITIPAPYDQLTRLQSLVARITYKPGFKLSVEEDLVFGSEYLRIFFSMSVVDAFDLRNTEMLSSTVAIQKTACTGYSDEYLLNQIIRQRIIEMEMHEVDEFLKFDGLFIVDPHPELRLQMSLNNAIIRGTEVTVTV